IEGHPAVDRIVYLDRTRGLAGYRNFIADLRSEKYDVALDLGRHTKSGVTSFLSRAPLRVGFHRRNAKELNWLFNNRDVGAAPRMFRKIHQFQKFGDLLGLPPIEEPYDYGLVPTAEERQKVAALFEEEARRNSVAVPKEVVGVICGASFETKRWPA